MKVKRKEAITLYTLYGTVEPQEIVTALREALGSEIEVVVCSGSLRDPTEFPFIKDNEGRPYYGKKGIEFYLQRRAKG